MILDRSFAAILFYLFLKCFNYCKIVPTLPVNTINNFVIPHLACTDKPVELLRMYRKYTFSLAALAGFVF